MSTVKKISERKPQHARYANPLTLLPGNVPIYQRIDMLLQRQADFAVAYLNMRLSALVVMRIFCSRRRGPELQLNKALARPSVA